MSQTTSHFSAVNIVTRSIVDGVSGLFTSEELMVFVEFQIQSDLIISGYVSIFCDGVAISRLRRSETGRNERDISGIWKRVAVFTTVGDIATQWE